MRIAKISVLNLFGMFNHSINLNMGDRITIVHGPNGFGKTILLRMINSLFDSRYSELYDIPFSELEIYFEDGKCLQIKKLLEEGEEGLALNLKSSVIRNAKSFLGQASQLSDWFPEWLDIERNYCIAKSFLGQASQLSDCFPGWLDIERTHFIEARMGKNIEEILFACAEDARGKTETDIVKTALFQKIINDRFKLKAM